MNIFNALSAGNGRISETNITSFMSYLLDSSNELNNAFFILFVNLIDESNEQSKLSDLFKISKLNIREQISTFSQFYSVDSEPEFSIKHINGTRQIPDILLRVSNREGEDLAYLIIENKINKYAKNNKQLKSQFEYFHKSEDFDETKPTYSILISPDQKIFESMISESIKSNDKTIWLKWKNNYDFSKDSIESILRKLVIAEHNAEIAPIDPNTQYIIKSFIDYLSSNFSKAETIRNVLSFKGGNIVDIADVKVNNRFYKIKRFSNKSILIFDENDIDIKESVKPILREINNFCKLDVDLYHSTGTEKNTRVLGRDIINRLNEIKN